MAPGHRFSISFLPHSLNIALSFSLVSGAGLRRSQPVGTISARASRPRSDDGRRVGQRSYNRARNSSGITSEPFDCTMDREPGCVSFSVLRHASKTTKCVALLASLLKVTRDLSELEGLIPKLTGLRRLHVD